MKDIIEIAGMVISVMVAVVGITFLIGFFFGLMFLWKVTIIYIR